jgi:hypothetical protein
MSTADFLIKFHSLPAELRKQVADYVEFLFWRKDLPSDEQKSPTGKKPISGLLKGKIWIADGFDAQMDDPKEYMET